MLEQSLQISHVLNESTIREQWVHLVLKMLLLLLLIIVSLHHWYLLLGHPRVLRLLLLQLLLRNQLMTLESCRSKVHVVVHWNLCGNQNLVLNEIDIVVGNHVTLRRQIEVRSMLLLLIRLEPLLLRHLVIGYNESWLSLLLIKGPSWPVTGILRAVVADRRLNSRFDIGGCALCCIISWLNHIVSSANGLSYVGRSCRLTVVVQHIFVPNGVKLLMLRNLISPDNLIIYLLNCWRLRLKLRLWLLSFVDNLVG